MDNLITDNLYETNKDIILYLMNKLNITTPLVEDYPTDLNSTERLVDLCKKYNATTYLAGQGGKEYLNKDIIDEIKDHMDNSPFKINLIHVRAHTGKSDPHSLGNEIVDILAKKGAYKDK
jgi:hypothetical protein